MGDFTIKNSPKNGSQYLWVDSINRYNRKSKAKLFRNQRIIRADNLKFDIKFPKWLKRSAIAGAKLD